MRQAGRQGFYERLQVREFQGVPNRGVRVLLKRIQIYAQRSRKEDRIL